MAASLLDRSRVSYAALVRRAMAVRRWCAILVVAALGAGLLHAAPAVSSLERAFGVFCPDARAEGKRGTKQPQSSLLERAPALLPQTLASADPPPAAAPALPDFFQSALPLALRERRPPRAPPIDSLPLYLITLRLRN
jgi:hypothetical protein